MSKQIKVDYDAKSNRFLLRCPVHANDLVRALPNYRWLASERAWAVPVIRKNAEAISASIAPFADISAEAQDAIVKATTVTIATGDSWPFWYSFKTEPAPYQLTALQKLYSRESMALFMDMGTGKSKTAIDMAAAKRMEGRIESLLIVCKLSLRNNWVEQFDIHCPIPVSIHLPDTTKQKAFDRWLREKSDFKVLIVGTESLSAGRMFEMADLFMKTASKPAMVIDESSMIAGAKAERSKRCVALGRQAVFRMALTGTPLRETPLDVYMQFEYLDPNIIGIGDYYAFRNRYAVMGGYKDPKTGKPLQVVGYQNLDELIETIAPYTFQITKKQALPELPDKRYQRRTLELTKRQKALYDQMKKEGAYMVNGKELVVDNVLGQILRLHQVCSGIAAEQHETTKIVKGEERVIRSYTHALIEEHGSNPKVQEVISILKETSDPVIVWCAYLPEIKMLIDALKEEGMEDQVVEFHGSVSEEDRDLARRAFQAKTKRIFIGNAQTGGMGLTLTAATTVVYMSNTHKMEERLQSEDRAHRRGQTVSPLYIDLVMDRTVDQTIIKSLQEKKDLSDFVRARLAHATRADLEKLFNGDA